MTQPNREPKSAESVQDGPEGLARYFHDTYERLAPHFGYETREETRAFDPTTPNGRLMISVCAHAMGSKWMRPTYGPTSPETEHVEPKREGWPGSRAAEDVVERVARAICDEEWEGSQPWDRKPESFKNRYRDYARAALREAAKS